MRIAAVSSLILSFAISSAVAQESGPDITLVDNDEYLIQFDESEGELLVDFIHLAKNLLLKPIMYDAHELADKRIWVVGPQRVKREEFADHFHSILKANGYLLVPTGPEGSGLLRVERVQRGSRNSLVGPTSSVVNEASLHNYRHQAEQLITTSITLEKLSAKNMEAQLTCWTNTTSLPCDARFGLEVDVVTLTGFGTNVWKARQLINALDAAGPKPSISKRTLSHTQADEMVTLVEKRLRAMAPTRNTATRPTPRIVADPTSNCVLILGDAQGVREVGDVVSNLDLEPTIR